MNLKRLLGWAVLAFIAYYVFSDPAGAGQTAHSLLGILQHAGNSVASFFNSVSS